MVVVVAIGMTFTFVELRFHGDEVGVGHFAQGGAGGGGLQVLEGGLVEDGHHVRFEPGAQAREVTSAETVRLVRQLQAVRQVLEMKQIGIFIDYDIAHVCLGP